MMMAVNLTGNRCQDVAAVFLLRQMKVENIREFPVTEKIRESLFQAHEFFVYILIKQYPAC